jgi:PncC family amidohydrolase
MGSGHWHRRSGCASSGEPDREDALKDLIAIAEDIAPRLIAAKQTISVAESSTGGLISAALLAIPGASAFYVGGAVVYTRVARRVVMDIPDQSMRGIRSASEVYAAMLAQQSRERLGTTWGLAETGASGPSGNGYGDAAGHSCLAVSGPSQQVITIETGSGDRVGNMHAFAKSALELLLANLQG